jgi:cytochrome c-type biogenesis protein CcmH/NrfG
MYWDGRTSTAGKFFQNTYNQQADDRRTMLAGLRQSRKQTRRMTVKLTGSISHIQQAVTGLLLLMLAACDGIGMDDRQLLERAAEYTQNGEMNAAVIELKNILQRNPDNAEARYRLASIYLEYEDYPAAEKQFRRAGEAGWNPAESRIGLVKSMLEQNEYSAALKECVVDDAFPVDAQADLTALRAVALTGLEQQEDARAALSAG